MNLPIRIVIATRKTIDEYKRSDEYKVIAQFNKIHPINIRLFDKNSRGLSSVYNQSITEVKNLQCILIFMHDDVLITDMYWVERIIDGFKKFDILGVVGNKKPSQDQPSWVMINEVGELDNFENLSGAIGQGDRFPPQKIDIFGKPDQEVKQMDGCFLAVKSETLYKSGIRFDPTFKFHFYDMDFCRSADKAKLKMGTIPLSIIHKSYGVLNEDWKKNYLLYLKKWQIKN